MNVSQGLSSAMSERRNALQPFQILYKRMSQESERTPNVGPRGEGCQRGCRREGPRDGNLRKGESQSSVSAREHKASDRRRIVPPPSWLILLLCHIAGVGISGSE